MSEPIDPTRWKETASTFWRDRFAGEPNDANNPEPMWLETLIPIDRAVPAAVIDQVNADAHACDTGDTGDTGDITDSAAVVILDRLNIVRAIRGHHLCPLQEAARTPAGIRVRHRCPTGTWPLPELLASSGPLDESEVAAVITATCKALTALKSAGLDHGDLRLAALLVDPGGNVLIGGAGCYGAAGPGARDRDSLTRLVAELLSSTAVSGRFARMRLELERRWDDLEFEQIGSKFAEFAAPSLVDLFRRRELSSGEPLPNEHGLRQNGTRPRKTPSIQTRSASQKFQSPPAQRKTQIEIERELAGGSSWFRGGWRRPRWLGAIAGATAILAWLAMSANSDRTATAAAGSIEPIAGTSVSSSPSHSAVTAATAASITSEATAAPPSISAAPAHPYPSGPIPWSDLVGELDSRRQAAFKAVDATLLPRVNAAGSAALRNDQDIIAALTKENAKPVGANTTIERVTVIKENAAAATVEVVDRRSAYVLVDQRTGKKLSRIRQRGSMLWLVELVRQDGEWLVSSVSSGKQSPRSAP